MVSGQSASIQELKCQLREKEKIRDQEIAKSRETLRYLVSCKKKSSTTSTKSDTLEFVRTTLNRDVRELKRRIAEKEEHLRKTMEAQRPSELHIARKRSCTYSDENLSGARQRMEVVTMAEAADGSDTEPSQEIDWYTAAKEEAKTAESKTDCPMTSGGRQRNLSTNEKTRIHTMQAQDSEVVTHEEELELSVDERKEEVNRVAKSSLQMIIQGFKCKKRMNEESDRTRLQENEDPGPKADAVNPTFIEFVGRKFHTDRCYYYNPEQCLPLNRKIVVGITSFHSESLADCVLVVPASDTFLGAADIQSLPTLRSIVHVQLRIRIDPLPLSSLGDECQDPISIPRTIYEPQTTGSWQSFGYLLCHEKQERLRRRKEVRVAELFSGAGGMHQGYSQQGFKTVLGIENDPYAVQTYTYNNKVSVLPIDVNSFLDKYKRDKNYQKQLGRIDLLHVSAPCQGFSSANRNGGKDDKANNDLSLTFVEGMRLMNPLAGVFENVEGMWRRKHIRYLKTIVAELLNMDYQVRCSLLRACDYGDPQKRKRLFIFAAKSFVLMPRIPIPTHGTEPDQIPFVTVKDAIGELKSKKVEDSVTCNIMDSKTAQRKGQDEVVKLKENEMAPTVRANGPRLLHYDEDRSITVEETAYLQSFRPGYQVFGSLQEQYRQVGNAVPVKLATAVARTVQESLEYVYREEEMDGSCRGDSS